MYYLLFILVLITDAVPLRKKLTNERACIDGLITDICYTNLNEVLVDLKTFGRPISELMENYDAHDSNKFDGTLEADITKPLSLVTLEKADKQISDTPMGHLVKYGYLKGVISATTSDYSNVTNGAISDAVYTYADFMRVDVSQAVRKMAEQRCGNPDIVFDSDGHLSKDSAKVIRRAIGEFKDLSGLRDQEERSRKKRYAIHGRVEKSRYTWKLVNTTGSDTLMKYKVSRAFKQWQDAIEGAVTFDENTAGSDSDWNLSFVPDAHSDKTFLGTELAHAPFPNREYHGQVHYRASVQFGGVGGYNFHYITLHELGHVLGLAHSMVPDSVMLSTVKTRPTATEADHEDTKLSVDDILGIKLLYNPGDGDCKEGWTGYYGRCFKAGDRYINGISWNDAQNKCREMGATLVAANDVVLMRFISTDVRLANVRTIWLGHRGSERYWANGAPFDAQIKPQQNNGTDFGNIDSSYCLVQEVQFGKPLWSYRLCTGPEEHRDRVERFVCEESPGFSTSVTPTGSIATTTNGDIDELTPCQNYIRGVVRRGEYLYIFGNTHFFKYLSVSDSPVLQEGYPKLISSFNFPQGFSAVMNDPYSKKKLYIVAGKDVYQWKLHDRTESIEDGMYTRKRKQRQVKDMFSEDLKSIVGAYKSDSRCLTLFSKDGTVGRWRRKVVDKSTTILKKQYHDITKKWNYFDVKKIQGITDSYKGGYAIVFGEEEFWEFRKTDGKQGEKKKIAEVFQKLTICEDIPDPIIITTAPKS